MLLADFLPAAAKPFAERTDGEKALILPWFERAKWFMALRRVGFDPTDAAHAPKRHRHTPLRSTLPC